MTKQSNSNDDDIPILTDIVQADNADIGRQINELSDEQHQQLVELIEQRLRLKLTSHFEQLQQVVMDNALNELKNELPELVRQVKHNPDSE